MVKDISKKLTMKKSFFVTQLEGFFNAISQEYQELIHQKEVENSLLEEKIQKLEKDIENLVKIRHELTQTIDAQKAEIEHLHKEKFDTKDFTQDDYYKKLLEENRALREQLNTKESEEVKMLKAQVDKLKAALAKGANSYQETLQSQNKEALIEEISKSLKR